MTNTLAGLLFPSWRLFEEVGEYYSIDFSFFVEDQSWTSWYSVSGFWTPPQRRNFLELFYAPVETYRLWKVTQLNKFIFLLQSHDFDSEAVQELYCDLTASLSVQAQGLRSPSFQRWRFSVVGSQSGRIFESESFLFTRPA